MNPPTPQLEHDASASPANCSQCARLLAAFHEAGEGTWVPMPELARAMSPTDRGTGNCPPRRIFDLKKKIKPDGWTIRNFTDRKVLPHLSYYRIVRIGSELDAAVKSVTLQPSNASTLQP